jgi:NitT/TauT family transport system substrate-binding protein
MQGDVLVVRTELIQDNPDLVKRLVKVTRRATDWIDAHPDETAEIMAEQLQAAGDKYFSAAEAPGTVNLKVTPEIISRSMGRIEYSTDINPAVVQQTIDFMVELGYIDEGLRAADILDLRYLQDE